MYKIMVIVVCYLFVEFYPEEVGAEGEGYIWRSEAEFDDEMEQMRDVWGKDLFGLLINVLWEQGSCLRILGLKDILRGRAAKP